MLLTWFMFSSIYLCLGMCKKANIRNVHSQVVKDYVGYLESKKTTTLKTVFSKPDSLLKEAHSLASTPFVLRDPLFISVPIKHSTFTPR